MKSSNPQTKNVVIKLFFEDEGVELMSKHVTLNLTKKMPIYYDIKLTKPAGFMLLSVKEMEDPIHHIQEIGITISLHNTEESYSQLQIDYIKHSERSVDAEIKYGNGIFSNFKGLGVTRDILSLAKSVNSHLGLQTRRLLVVRK